MRRAPWLIDLRPAHDQALRDGVEADARADFEAAFRPPGKGQGPPAARGDEPSRYFTLRNEQP